MKTFFKAFCVGATLGVISAVAAPFALSDASDLDQQAAGSSAWLPQAETAR